MKRHGEWWALAVVVVAMGVSLGACGSDDFNLLGGRLPIDVSQDSLAVADTLVGTVQELRIVPIESQPLVNREVLYLGSFGPLGLKATPLMRFSFSDIPSSIDIFAYEWTNIWIDLEWLKLPKVRPSRSLAIYALADTLSAAMATQPLSTILGDSLASLSGILGATSRDIPLERTLVESWIRSGGHTGLALVDRTSTPDTNLVGLAGRQFISAAVLDSIGQTETVIPEIHIEVQIPTQGSIILNFPILEDVTHFVRPPQTDELELVAHQPARAWFRFGFEGIDQTSTINSAILALPIDPLKTIGLGSVTLAAYRCTAAEATVVSLGSLEEVLGSGRTHDLVNDPILSVDVTEFVQRSVNGVLREDDGVLVALDSELLLYHLLTFYPSTHPDPARRPRIELRVTPPSDYVE